MGDLLWFSPHTITFAASACSHSYLVLPHSSQQKKEISIFNCVLPTKGKHFYSSSESEEEEESHKKFNIKIKPLQSKDVLKTAATVDELKASIGNIALSPSPVVSGGFTLSSVRLGGECVQSHVLRVTSV